MSYIRGGTWTKNSDECDAIAWENDRGLLTPRVEKCQVKHNSSLTYKQQALASKLDRILEEKDALYDRESETGVSESFQLSELDNAYDRVQKKLMRELQK